MPTIYRDWWSDPVFGLMAEYNTETHKWRLTYSTPTMPMLVDVTTTHPGVVALIMDRITTDFIEDTQREHSETT